MRDPERFEEGYEWGDVKEGSWVTSLGRHGAGQPAVTGVVQRIERDIAHVLVAQGGGVSVIRQRTISNLRKVKP